MEQDSESWLLTAAELLGSRWEEINLQMTFTLGNCAVPVYRARHGKLQAKLKPKHRVLLC